MTGTTCDDLIGSVRRDWYARINTAHTTAHIQQIIPGPPSQPLQLVDRVSEGGDGRLHPPFGAGCGHLNTKAHAVQY